ncbi:MAG: NAD(P)H-hydrate epimerase [Candidatus Omnitrophica bacterium]|nr:NAD(P)H-hydrate epimerase [Candidatus Omnitrophota bacterium]MBU2044242.1 NAD(P)H-hydrate epimerase [Candidatus Omnitrophota bacterium]MBU2266199.1 NAD(P)H-hydrate epimerase [Candidatus Omnitrophota bacterium]MBU2473441.1 NAD(P)H-hydrate epimerase [Candidatus Omnitrophota bacterium]
MTSRKGLPVDKIRELEAKAKEIGLSESLLIENASSNLFEIIQKLNLGTKAMVVAGRGNNGADVLSCARKLLSRGFEVKVIVLSEKPPGQEALRQKNILEKLGILIYDLKVGAIHELPLLLEESDFILEGIFGIGIKGEVSFFHKEVIAAINESGKKIVSCDIPSGLSPDEGLVLGQAVEADYTITFLAAKKGFYLNQGPEYCGKIFVVDIGVSRQMLEEPV